MSYQELRRLNYQDLRQQQSQARKSIKSLHQSIQLEMDNLLNIEDKMSDYVPRRIFRTSLRAHMDNLMQLKAWKRKKEWSRQDVQKRPEFAGVNAVSLNVLLFNLCKNGDLIRVRKGHYKCA